MSSDSRLSGLILTGHSQWNFLFFKAKMLKVAQSLNEFYLNEVRKKRSNTVRTDIHNQKSQEILKKDHKRLRNKRFLKQCFENWKSNID